MRRTVARFLIRGAVLLLPLTVTAVLHAGQADVLAQLAEARAATVQYHDPDVAIADGYVNVGPNPLEGGLVEFPNLAGDLIDCTLDIRHPEALRYAESGNGLRLVAVEYVIPMACSPEPPEDFLPGVGEWEPESLAPDLWTKAVYLWSGKSLSDGN